MKQNFLYFIVFTLLAMLYIAYVNKSVSEHFTPKINQMWRPHYRNFRLFATDSFSSAQGGFRRFLRQKGIL